MNRNEESPMEKTYRFWIYHNGSNVRLSLKVGDTVTLTSGGPTDEGWDWQQDVYYIDQERGILICEHAYDGVDCDGRLSGGSDHYAQLDELAVNLKPWIEMRKPTPLQRHELDTRPVYYPIWQSIDTWRRDHQAEAAGF